MSGEKVVRNAGDIIALQCPVNGNYRIMTKKDKKTLHNSTANLPRLTRNGHPVKFLIHFYLLDITRIDQKLDITRPCKILYITRPE